MEREVAITGLGVIAPNGIGLSQFWANAIAGVSGIAAADWPGRYGFASNAVGRVKDFDPIRQSLTYRQKSSLARNAQFAVVAAREAVSDAGLVPDYFDPRRLGVAIGSMLGGAQALEEEYLCLTDDGISAIDPDWFSKSPETVVDFSTPAVMVATEHRAEGTVFCPSSGCVAGLEAIGWAMRAVRRGDLDIVIAGATEAPITPLAVATLEGMGLLSTRPPARASCPYSAERDGLVLSEGCGILIIEEADRARTRGAGIYAMIEGFASGGGTSHNVPFPDDGAELGRIIASALAEARRTPDTIGHVSAQGNSTPQGDLNETNALKRVFGAGSYRLETTALKSMTGDALAAAGAIEMVALALECKTGVIHPTINYQEPDAACDLDYVTTGRRDSRFEAAIKIGSGLSDAHSVFVMRRVP